MKRFFFVFLLLPILSQAQQYKGIQFQTLLSWQEVITKAKAEYKYIFIQIANDSCKDCNAMINGVYSNEYIGKYFNAEFFSFRVTGELLNRVILKHKAPLLYEKDVLKHNTLTRYPIYLFFSPDGNLVHKGMGKMSPNVFMQLARSATNPSGQYYTLLNKYFSGIKDYPLMIDLAVRAKELGDKDTANLIATDFKKNYLDRLSDSELCTAANIEFINEFPQLESTNGRLFRLCFHKPEMVDKETNKGFAAGFVRSYINKEEVDEKLWKDGKVITDLPDWEKIASSVQKKFGRNYSEELIRSAKMVFYRLELKWREYVNAVNEFYKNKPPKPGEGLSSDSWDLNGRAWDVFLNCNDSSVLRSALQWSSMSIELDPVNVQYFDTKANLLYKLGQPDEAIAWQELAIQHEIVNARLRGHDKGAFQDDFKITLEKMKKRISTWQENKVLN